MRNRNPAELQDSENLVMPIGIKQTILASSFLVSIGLSDF